VLPQILAFLEVARRGNLSRAAKALYVTQPTLTARLQALEANLGEQLFVRTRRGMRLTEAGEAFLPYAEHAVKAIDDGRERLAELRRGTVGKLVLGSPPTVSTYTLPALLARFTEEHPGVRLTVMTGTSEEILDMVLHDRIQLGLMRALGHPEVEAVPVYSDTLVLVVSPLHRLAGHKVRLADLGNEPLVLFGRSSSYRDFTEAVFRQAGVMPDSVLELDNIEAAKKMVEHGIGISLVPDSAVMTDLANGVLSVVHVVDTALPRREIVAVRRADAGPPSGAVATFMAMLTEVSSVLPGGHLPPPPAAVAEPTMPALDS
jgi:DNA-binding transcriptional LysR family regulator